MNYGILGSFDNSQAKTWRSQSTLYTFLPAETNAPNAKYHQTVSHNTGRMLTGGNYGAWYWTVPDWIQAIHALLVGGGGGGCSGQRGTAGSSRSGGGGGGGAGSSWYWIPISSLPSRRLYIVVGSGGAGANGITSDNTNGGLGTAGSDTIIGSDKLIWPTRPGSAGGAAGNFANGGPISSAGATNGYVNVNYIGSAGANGGAGAVGSTTTGSTICGVCRGGGGGGGISAANGVFNGGAGGIAHMHLTGAVYTNWSVTSYTTIAGGTSGGNGESAFSKHGLAGSYQNEFPLIGASGGGGASSITANAGSGGNGSYGGGGGGGGASVNGFTSGAGGNGGPGIVLLFCFG